MTKQTKYLSSLITTILLWSATPAIATIALRELNNYQLLFFVSCIATISLFIAVIATGKLQIVLRYSRRDLAILFGMGSIGIFLYHIFLFGSFQHAPAGQVNVANYLWPVFICIFSVPILKEKWRLSTFIAVVISFLGVTLSLTQGNFQSFSNTYIKGYVLASLGAICYGLFSVLGKKFNFDRITSMFIFYASATILIVPTVLSLSHFTFPQRATTIISILILGIIMNSLAFVLWFRSLQDGHTHTTANAVFAIPFLAMVWTYILNNEPFVLASVFGMALIIVGIVIQAHISTQQSRK